MADIKWIKITTDVFDDEKVLLIESLPDSYAIIVVWFKLLCLAGKQNNSGVFLMNDRIAYTDKMLSTIFRMKESTVKMALDTFEQFGMIEMVDGVITIPNWGKHQNFDRLENRKEYMKRYMQDYREKQKGLSCKVNSKANSKANVNSLDKEEDKDKEEEKDILVTNVTNRQTQSVQRAVDEWNSLSEFGIKSISRVSSGSQRYQMLNARISQYGIDEILRAIENVRHSSFLQGRSSGTRQWVITFDWFVKPNNFPKVLDGNYVDEEITVSETKKDDDEWQ